jgi:hypothetical protein
MYVIVKTKLPGGGIKYNAYEIPDAYQNNEKFRKWFIQDQRDNWGGVDFRYPATHRDVQSLESSGKEVTIRPEAHWWRGDGMGGIGGGADGKSAFEEWQQDNRTRSPNSASGRMSQLRQRRELGRQGVDPGMMHPGKVPTHQSPLHNPYVRGIPNAAWGGGPALLHPGTQGFGGTQEIGFRGHNR